jgi:co-chaperonin GroES (HSP10)
MNLKVSDIKPQNDWLLVQPKKAEEKKSLGGIILQADNKAPHKFAEVIAAGKGTKSNPTTTKAGDIVLLHIRVGNPFQIDGQEYFFIKESDIIATV